MAIERGGVRVQPLSGFPEWLPEVRRVELAWLDRTREVFERYGFCSIETPAVERLEVLLAKSGDTDKEIYAVSRLARGEGGEDGEASPPELGLRYDLTVPLARYVARYFDQLAFPLRRYQIARVWRGERPQEGRYREFYQCDLDVLNPGTLPLAVDAELAAIMYELLEALGVGPVTIRVNNRRVLDGALRGLGVAEPVAVIRLLDKLDKLGAERVAAQIVARGLAPAAVAERCVALAAVRAGDGSLRERVEAVPGLAANDTLARGLSELAQVVSELAWLPPGAVVADLSVARGFDYYTGTVYEVALRDFPALGSVCSGGRYDDLAGALLDRKLPGVGISFGLTRAFGKMLAAGRIAPGARGPADVLVVVPPGEGARAAARRDAAALRRRGVRAEVYCAEGDLRAQMRYANRTGVPYVWFAADEASARAAQVKDMATGVQRDADAASWSPRAVTTA